MEQAQDGMPIVNMHDAKTNLSRLVEQAALGYPFVIAKAGRPLVKVTALTPPEAAPKRRFGFLTEPVAVPDDFDSMGATDIAAMFEGDA